MFTDPTESPAGAICWHELYSTETKESTKFYKKVFGWEIAKPQDMGEMKYQFLSRNEEMFGGLMATPPGVPPHWLLDIAVDDVDKTAKKFEKLGGTVKVPPMDIPMGRMAVVAHPQGAMFGIWKRKEE